MDYLYFVTLNKVPENERLVIRLAESGHYCLTELDKEKVLSYASLFQRKRLEELIHKLIP